MSESKRSRAEVEAMFEMWLATNKECERTGNWEALAEYYADDPSYRYTIGAFGTREAKGREEVRQLVMERDMIGFEGWAFPYEWVVIDGDRIMTKWYMQPPHRRPDGSPYRVLGMSAIRLNNDLEIAEMEDSMDIAALFAMADEMRAAGQEVNLPSAPDLS